MATDGVKFSGGIATIDKVANEADEIYEKFVNARIDPRNTTVLTDFYNHVKKEHNDFFSNYWFIVKSMIFMGIYDKSSLIKYLKRVARRCAESDEQLSLSDKIELDAEYIVYIYKKTTPHYDPKKAAKLKREIADSMLKELKLYKKQVEIIRESVDKKHEEYEQQRINDKKKLIIQLLRDAREHNQ